MKILLLSCCAPCSCAVIEKLSRENADFAVLFYNPNIRPYEEYLKRLEENKRICKQFNVQFIDLEYDNNRWCKLTKGLENEPERGKRCDKCIELRLTHASNMAKELGIDLFTTSLVISPHKNFEKISAIGSEAAKLNDIQYLSQNFKKKDGFLKTNAISKELGIYRQNYCGCEFAKQ